MKKNIYSDLTDEQLLKKRNFFKGISIAFALIFIVAISILLYLFVTKGFKNSSIVTLLPIFMLPITLMPLFINFSLIHKEIKSRKI
ncbi:hypothetical protein [Flavobacterium difficile]|uniref:Redox-active disulfide protein 2 n=1 Tax=Flavobacterium difficile TaxID=2709659 RepID=A0ABX0I4B0_9FLAO|nr:hypothetical protein [Flavobacterium difficile]NHM01412.1 hypothetical protein [Flavobacterium difficile]